ncbi:MAG: CapA family protein [Alphaproteobacteria bacterium]|nr:CapA family protein [Alphaproteobacteria bacterium]
MLTVLVAAALSGLTPASAALGAPPKSGSSCLLALAGLEVPLTATLPFAPRDVLREDENELEGADAQALASDPEALAPLQRTPPPARAVLPETEIVIAAMGDIIPHALLQAQAAQHPLGFRSLWRNLEPVLQRADIRYANLETPLAEGIPAEGAKVADPVAGYDGLVYSGYPRFNAPPGLAHALKASRFDIVSTANNHCLDRGAIGIDLTIAALRGAGLALTGTRSRDADPGAPWHAITEARGFRIAWLACTYGTNGFSDRHGQVLHCYRDRPLILRTIAQLKADPRIDAVIVTPHFGIEYSENPTPAQKVLARQMLKAGAIAVLGSHSHVVQPWEWRPTGDGGTGFILYSLGNFVSNQEQLWTRSALILLLGLARAVSGEVVISGVGYLPILVALQPDADHTDLSVQLASATHPTSQANWCHVVDRLGTAALQAQPAVFTTFATPSPGPGAAPGPALAYEGQQAIGVAAAASDQAAENAEGASLTIAPGLADVQTEHNSGPVEDGQISPTGEAGFFNLVLTSQPEGPASPPQTKPAEGRAGL